MCKICDVVVAATPGNTTNVFNYLKWNMEWPTVWQSNSETETAIHNPHNFLCNPGIHNRLTLQICAPLAQTTTPDSRKWSIRWRAKLCHLDTISRELLCQICLTNAMQKWLARWPKQNTSQWQQIRNLLNIFYQNVAYLFSRDCEILLLILFICGYHFYLNTFILWFLWISVLLFIWIVQNVQQMLELQFDKNHWKLSFH